MNMFKKAIIGAAAFEAGRRAGNKLEEKEEKEQEIEENQENAKERQIEQERKNDIEAGKRWQEQQIEKERRAKENQQAEKAKLAEMEQEQIEEVEGDLDLMAEYTKHADVIDEWKDLKIEFVGGVVNEYTIDGTRAMIRKFAQEIQKEKDLIMEEERRIEDIENQNFAQKMVNNFSSKDSPSVEDLQDSVARRNELIQALDQQRDTLFAEVESAEKFIDKLILHRVSEGDQNIAGRTVGELVESLS